MIHTNVLKAEPVDGDPLELKATRVDGSLTRIRLFPPCEDSDHSQFERQAELFGKAEWEFGASLPRMLGWGYTTGEGIPYLETEWLEGENLASRFQLAPGYDLLVAVAEQVSRVLTICHKLDLPHRDLRAENIWWQSDTHRFLLLNFDFCNPGLQDPNLQTSLEIAKRKDIKDLGILLRSLAGRVGAPDSLPDWLAHSIERLVSDDPAMRYQHIGEFYLSVLKNAKREVEPEKQYRSKPQQAAGKTKPVRSRLLEKNPLAGASHQARIPGVVLAAVLALSLLAGWIFLPKKQAVRTAQAGESDTTLASIAQQTDTAASLSAPIQPTLQKKLPSASATAKVRKPKRTNPSLTTSADSSAASVNSDHIYKVKSVAYFHNQPDPSTRRNAFINKWNNAKLKPLSETEDFIYIVYTNDEGRTSKGWLSKRDLIEVPR